MKDIDEPYRSLIYPKVFENFLNEELREINKELMSLPSEPTPIPAVLRRRLGEVEPRLADEGISKIMSATLDWSKYSYIHRLEPYEQYLLVLKIAHDEFGVDGLTSPEVRNILFEKFRISKRYEAISMALSSLRGRDVDRVPKGNGFAYRISKMGEDRIQNSRNKLMHNK